MTVPTDNNIDNKNTITIASTTVATRKTIGICQRNND
jgi:hypothetical protein